MRARRISNLPKVRAIQQQTTEVTSTPLVCSPASVLVPNLHCRSWTPRLGQGSRREAGAARFTTKILSSTPYKTDSTGLKLGKEWIIFT